METKVKNPQKKKTNQYQQIIDQYGYCVAFTDYPVTIKTADCYNFMGNWDYIEGQERRDINDNVVGCALRYYFCNGYSLGRIITL